MKQEIPNYVRELACRLGSESETALMLGKILWSTQGSHHEGVELLCAAAQAGEAEALHVLGLACFRGQGVEKNLAAARELQQAAAVRGLADAQFELSLLLAQGLGGEVDAQGARRWEAKAAKAGHPRACLNRGARLANRKRPDWANVMRWYARAAAGGSAEATVRLCMMTKKPETSSFLAQLQAEIAEATPESLGNAEKFMKGGSAEETKLSLKGNVVRQNEDAKGDFNKSSKEAPAESGVPAKAVTPIAAELTAAPQLNAAEAIPAPKPDAEVSLRASKADVQSDLDKAKLTDGRLRNAKDRRFSALLSAKDVKGRSTRSGHMLDDLNGPRKLDSIG